VGRDPDRPRAPLAHVYAVSWAVYAVSWAALVPILLVSAPVMAQTAAQTVRQVEAKRIELAIRAPTSPNEATGAACIDSYTPLEFRVVGSLSGASDAQVLNLNCRTQRRLLVLLFTYPAAERDAVVTSLFATAAKVR
jgi:hypothetical protein